MLRQMGGDLVDEEPGECHGPASGRSLRWSDGELSLDLGEGLIHTQCAAEHVELARLECGEFSKAEAGVGGGEDERSVSGVDCRDQSIDFVSVGLAVVYGPPGIGKTFAALHGALCVAGGEAFLGLHRDIVKCCGWARSVRWRDLGRFSVGGGGQ